MPPKMLNNKDLLETADILGQAKDFCELCPEFFERFSSYLSQFTGIERPDYVKEKILEFFSENQEMTLSLVKLQMMLTGEGTVVLDNETKEDAE